MISPTVVYLEGARARHRALERRARDLPPDVQPFATEVLAELSLACTMLESEALHRPERVDRAGESRRLRAEMVEGLMEEAAFYRAVVENLPTGLAVVDPDCQLRYTNPAGSDELGFEADELHARPALDLVHPDDVRTAEHEFHALFDHPERRAARPLRVRRRDGAWLWLEVFGRCARKSSPVEGLMVSAAPMQGAA